MAPLRQLNGSVFSGAARSAIAWASTSDACLRSASCPGLLWVARFLSLARSVSPDSFGLFLAANEPPEAPAIIATRMAVAATRPSTSAGLRYLTGIE